MEKLNIKHLVPYLEHKVLVNYKDCLDEKYVNAYLTGVSTGEIETTYKRKRKGCSGDIIGWEGHNNVVDMEVKIYLIPLSRLVIEIEHKGERFIPSEWFEIGDDENNCQEYDSGNIKLCKNIAWASLDPYGHDARMLPYGVIEKLLEWHFDVFGLIEKGLAIEK